MFNYLIKVPRSVRQKIFKRGEIAAKIKARKRQRFAPECTFAANIRFLPPSFAAIPNGRGQKIHRTLLPKSNGFQIKIHRIQDQSPMDSKTKSDGFFPHVRRKESPSSVEKMSETAILAEKMPFSVSYKRLIDEEACALRAVRTRRLPQ